jgi:hypothetical protein
VGAHEENNPVSSGFFLTCAQRRHVFSVEKTVELWGKENSSLTKLELLDATCANRKREGAEVGPKEFSAENYFWDMCGPKEI